MNYTSIYVRKEMSSFDPQKMLKATGLSPKDKLLSTLSNKASSMTSQLSGEVASRLAQAGQSLQSATAFAAAKTDALLSSAPTAFSSMAALGGGTPAVERISRSDLVSLRGGGEIRFDPQSVIPESQEDGQYTDTTKYPADLPDDYRMCLQFTEYERPNLARPATLGFRFSISLPIPNTLLESYGVSYSEGQYGATLGNVVRAAVDGGGMPAGEGLVGAGRGLAQSLVTNSVVGKIPGVDNEGLSGLVDQTFGSIVNPHLALFLKGVSLREHQFSWAFAPRNSQDSRNLKEIYYRIKRASLPAFTANASNTTLDYPMMVKISIKTKDGKELYPFKVCIISAINMNYASSGVPAFHADGAPVLQQLSMGLKEIEYFTSDAIRDAHMGEFTDVETNTNFSSTGITPNDVSQFGGRLVEFGASVPAAAANTVTQLTDFLGAVVSEPPE